MEAPVSSTSSVNPEAISKCELLILHTAEAQEWATYLQQILKSSLKLCEYLVVPYAVSPDDQPLGYNLESFQSCKCIVLLLTGVLLDLAADPQLQTALQELLHPPHRVVALLCGVSEADVSPGSFRDWSSWRKIYAEDEPAVYVSTILESVTDSRQAKDECKSKAASNISAASSNQTDETQEVASGQQQRAIFREKETASDEITAGTQLTCLTVQPNRVLCGAQETLYVVFKHKLDDQCAPEVEFTSEKSTKRVSGCVENEYTLSVTAPDMPAGLASLTLLAGQSRVGLKPVTYYTNMGEVSRCLENASDPISFICQAFNLTSNATETLDNMLTDSLKSRLPATSLQLFGVKQIEEDNMSSYQRTEELPTLLHFAAKYGLKKLTTTLLRCPGALQAYSVMNKHGDYPNTLAEKSGFTDLRQFMDEFVETADMLKSHLEDTINTDEGAEVYEFMSAASQDIIMKYSTASEDIYESMLGIDPECAEDLYEVMNAVDENPEEAMLIKFFQGKPHDAEKKEKGDDEKVDEAEEEEEDPYNLCPEDIYDTVDPDSSYNPVILNRPPAPIPRPERAPQQEQAINYISRVFSSSDSSASRLKDQGYPAARPVVEPPASTYDPYAGMKTPGQRQLISLQERVKVGEITVNEAVQEFKEWQFDHERRTNSIRYQQENLKKLRDSITRRHKEREKEGKELDYEISAPLPRSMYWSSNVAGESGVYEPAPRMVAPPPAASQAIQRGNWKTGSTSSTSSSESNRLSTHSTFSYSSGTEPEFEDNVESLSNPLRPPRPSDAFDLPPRIPPRIPERVPELAHERYISCPQRALPQRPSPRHTDSPPPVPRRLR
ncbi:phosphoinositide 3-kinase adapter protein 1 isoform X2 [Salarias fasciatus]|uniref:DBB domain-containing protein n=1 Tax=Salarias fasciatus TaxID=181472 RepID=A0A672GUV3_SALFA|nr:phosphoinositide 3-kinase adapter protein 1 isoform X2 [Salarias fasciatus]